MKHRSLLVLCLFTCLAFLPISVAQTPASRIVAPVDDANLVTLTGNTHPLARAASDQGTLSESTPLNRMQLVLARSSEQEAALKQLLDQQQDRGSSSFHQWLTPQSFGAAFGPSDRDLATVTAWLAAQGFTGVHVSAGRTVIEFSGTAGSVQTAFHTAMHRYLVNGQQHFANASDPRIPAALAPVVAGVASLNNFAQQPALSTPSLSLVRDNKTGAITRAAAAPTASSSAATAAVHANYTTTNTSGRPVYAVTPGDLATIYNFAPLLNSNTPINGTGQSIAVAGDSDINATDFINFRTLFGLPLGTATATGTQYLNIAFNGPDPGTTSDEFKGDADTQWAGAVATNAIIDYIISESTSVTQGSDLSAQYIVDNNLAPVLVDSFNNCEANAGAAYNKFISSLWEQAAAQGITAVVSAGDNGSAGCDAVGATTATGGLAVNATASTPYNVAVGGTDFTGGWNTTPSSTLVTAPGYLVETAWNDNVGPDQIGPIVSGGSGGASSCATGTPGTGGAAGTCAGYPKPSWQIGVNGGPTDGVRDVPDVSLFAGDGDYGAFYFVCQQDAVTSPGCTVGTPFTNFVGAGGTSFSAAAFAGMIALVNQSMATARPTPSGGQGNVNYTLYALATKQAGINCAANGPPASTCIFNDITTGTNQMPCAAGSPSCSTGGVLSGYTSNAGYDLTTGLGSVNAQNLVNQWQTVTYNSTATTLLLNGGTSTVTIMHGTPVTASGSVTGNSGTPTGQVSIVANYANGAVGSATLNNGGDYSQAFANFPGSGTLLGTTTPASYRVNAYYGGDGTFAPSESNPAVNLIVTPENSTTTVSVIDATTPTPKTVTSVPYGEILQVQAKVAGVSGQGFPTGSVTFTSNGQPLYNGSYPLNSSGYADVQTTSLTVLGSPYSFTAAYAGDPSFNASASTPPYTLTIARAPTTASILPNAPTVSDGTTETFTVVINTTGYGYATPTGVVTITGSNGTVLGSATLSGVAGSGNYDSSFANITIPAQNIITGNTVMVTYPGDTNYLPSTAATGPITVTTSGLPATTTALTVVPNIVPFGGSTVFTATVTQPLGTPSNFNGMVSFFIDGISVGKPVLVSSNGTVAQTVSVAGFAAGNHTATAVFSGDSTHKASMSPAMPFAISSAAGTTQSTTTVTLNPLGNPTSVVQGTAIIVNAMVTPTTPTVPTGTLQLMIDGNAIGISTPVTATGTGSFTLVTSVLTVGPHTASVYYSGDATYSASFAIPVPFTVTAAGNTPTSIVISNVPSPVGQGITFPFTATISPNSPIPTGTTELIIDGGLPQAQVPLLGTDPATLSLNTDGLALGPHTVQVYYSGNTNLSAATSNTVTFDVIPQNSTFTLSPTSASAHIPLEGSTSNVTTFTVTPTVGDTFSVSFACTSGLPQNVTCSFSPATVTVTGLATATTNLTFVVGSYPQASLHRPSLPGGWYTMGGGVSFAGLFLLLLPRRNRRFASLLALLTLFALGAATGCGSGIAPQQGPFPVVVTATSSISVLGPTTQTATVNLTIGGQPSN